ncbi:PRTRC system protein E [Geomonas subterranea]|uniref:PRTRC system protein E n=1 Tax=Geomonas subterranea TaxID=2847989 RepID=UPI001CD63BC8|nr:PRTRC system protein E [Geomonas fuzhouensis]
MFKELAPIVATGTSLCIMISAAAEGAMTVTVLPQGKDQNAALNTPLSVTATPDELDNELPAVLTGYTNSRATLAETLENVKTIMEAAGKTASAAATKAATKGTAAASEIEEDEDEESESTSVPARTISKAAAPAAPKSVVSDLNLF